MKTILKTGGRGLMALAAACILACTGKQAFTERERLIIGSSDSLMYVTVLPEDSLILRSRSTELGPAELRSPELKALTDKMLYTVKHPSQDGVGIAAPQVGIDRRIFWVMRMDKAGEPFECYLNPQMDSLWGEVSHGPEGCLSAPPMRGLVPRYDHIRITYTHPQTLQRVTETVEGYTAIIFQHEYDHLEGTLYIDKADTLFRHDAWARERSAFRYEKPAWWPEK